MVKFKASFGGKCRFAEVTEFARYLTLSVANKPVENDVVTFRKWLEIDILFKIDEEYEHSCIYIPDTFSHVPSVNQSVDDPGTWPRRGVRACSVRERRRRVCPCVVLLNELRVQRNLGSFRCTFKARTRVRFGVFTSARSLRVHTTGVRRVDFRMTFVIAWRDIASRLEDSPRRFNASRCDTCTRTTIIWLYRVHSVTDAGEM